jgi:hypothetical protein
VWVWGLLNWQALYAGAGLATLALLLLAVGWLLGSSMGLRWIFLPIYLVNVIVAVGGFKIGRRKRMEEKASHEHPDG